MGLAEASVAAIGPALALFYLTFASYDRVLSDRGLFISLGVGFVLGWIFALPELLGALYLDPFVFGPEVNLQLIAGAGVSVFAIAFWQEGLRGLTMNLPAIRGKWQQPFWGMSLGLGSGAVLGVLLLAKGAGGALGLVDIVRNLPFVVAQIVAHGAFGGLVGIGVSEHRAVRGFFIASVGHMGFNGLIFVERMSAPLLGDPLASGVVHWALVAAMVLYAAGLYRHMLRQLPSMLPKAEQTRRRRLLRGSDT